MWLCSNCAEENEDNFEICWNCRYDKAGSPPIESKTVDEETDDLETQEITKKRVSKEKGTVYGKDEKILSTVGQKFLTSFLVGAGITKTSLMVTEKRIYGAGNNYSLKGKTFATIVGELRSLHSIGLEYK